VRVATDIQGIEDFFGETWTSKLLEQIAGLQLYKWI